MTVIADSGEGRRLPSTWGTTLSIEAVREFLKRPDCIIFVGSGISTWSGLPTWGKLLDELAIHMEQEGLSANLVRREMGNGEMLQAASYGVSRLTPTSFGTFIKKAVRVGLATPHAMHRAIVKLGPTSFITTNYDSLLEEALRQWREDDFFPPPITNKHLVELVEIVSARSSHFIFKPHGDASDASSIILTREQYRSLLPGGERQGALEAVKTLLTTRPVLYLGFGLRDPDFVYLRDILLNIYQGAIRDHWAIMPDVTVEESDYWRNYYGIRLLNYATTEDADGRRNHGALLSMLESLAAVDRPEPIASLPATALSDAERALALTRYTSGLVRRLAASATPIEARITAMNGGREMLSLSDHYQGWTTKQYLIDGPDTGYLIGLPGSGKSFALKLAARVLAERLQQACLEDNLDDAALTLPIMVDLKLYRGNLEGQIAAELPSGMDIEQLKGGLKIKLFLDAYNEMPTEFIESGDLLKSIDILGRKIGPFSYIISSRTSDGLPTDGVFYEIDRFDRRHVDAVLAERGIVLTGNQSTDAAYLLRRPFFLQLIATGKVELPENPRPRDLFSSFITNTQRSLSERFETDLELIPILSRVAYRAIESDSEAFPVYWIYDALSSRQTTTSATSELVNWLISCEFLIPYTGRRCSFVHQSITEYLAATELARRFKLGEISAREIISSKKWDQCLFLALSLLDREVADEVLGATLEADLGLAIGATRYAEDGQSEAVSNILQALIDRGKKFRERVGYHISLRNLPASTEHIPQLRALMADGNALGSEVVRLLAELLGSNFKDELLSLLADNWDDFNFAVNGIAPALSPLLSESDLPRILEIATLATTQNPNEDSFTAISNVMASFDAALLAPLALRQDCAPELIEIIAGAMRERDDQSAHELLAELLLINPNRVASSFALALPRAEDSSDWRFSVDLDGRHAEALWSSRHTNSLWASAMKTLCLFVPEVKRAAEGIKTNSTIEEISRLYFIGESNDRIFENINRLLDSSDDALDEEDFSVFDLSRLDWTGRSDLLVRLAGRRNVSLNKSLVEGIYRYQSYLPSHGVGLALLLPVLEWMGEYQSHDDAWWMRQRIGEFVAHFGDAEVQKHCLDGILRGSSAFKNWVKRDYISHCSISSDDLSGDMISALLSDLNVKGRIDEHFYNPLGHIATEQLVSERLLPLAEGAAPHFLDNLRIVLRAAGDRHMKRYLISGST